MKKLLLIPGHGDGDPGACAIINKVRYKEADEAVKVCKSLQTQLKHYNILVDIYNTKKNAYKELCNRHSIPFSGYDYVLEVHFNAGACDTKGNGKTTGVEILLPTRNTPKNQSLEKQLVKAVASIGFKNRGVKVAQLKVINTASVAGVSASLLEVCFIDDKDDMLLYSKKKAAIASVLAQVFIDKWKLKMTARVLSQVAFRSAKKVTPSNRLLWIPEEKEVTVLKEEGSWLKVKYGGMSGYIVRSKTSLV